MSHYHVLIERQGQPWEFTQVEGRTSAIVMLKAAAEMFRRAGLRVSGNEKRLVYLAADRPADTPSGYTSQPFWRAGKQESYRLSLRWCRSDCTIPDTPRWFQEGR